MSVRGLVLTAILVACPRADPIGPDAQAKADGSIDDRDASEGDASTATDAGPEWAHCPALDPAPAWITTSTLGVTARCADYAVAVTPYQDTIRLLYLPHGRSPLRSYAVDPDALIATHAELGGEGDDAILCTASAKVRLHEDCTLEIQDASGTVLARDVAFDPSRNTLRRDTPSTERFYGFGEKTGPLDKRGRRMTFWNTDAYDSTHGGFPPDQDPLYASIPFFIGLRDGTAYGLFNDSPHRSVMDMAAADPNIYEIRSEGVLDQYLVIGPKIAEVIERYTRFTGRTPLPPRWTLGYHQSRWGYSPASRVEEIAAELRARRIPADGIWLDIQHLDGFRTFTFDPIAFPDPSGMIARLEARDFSTVVIVDPGIKVDPAYAIFAEGVAGDHFLKTPSGELYTGVVWPGESAFPDFAKATTREWWGAHAGDLSEPGVRGIWLDVNEPTTFPESGGGSSIPDDVPAGDTTMAEVHNVYALLQAEATFRGRALAVPGERPFVLSRAGYAGIQRWAAMWTGDAPSTWWSLRQTMPMLLGLGLSGVPFAGSDIGGYSGNATPELYARWMALGAFSPFCRGHVTNGVNDQEPWAFGPEVEAISRLHLEERYRLLPYLYSLFDESARTGLPILRPLVLEFQDDPIAIEDQALLGPFLLFAPIVEEGATERSIYLPRGRWFEARSGAIYDGPTTITVQSTLAARPTFVREGAIIPRGPLTQSARESEGPLELDLYPRDAPSTFTVYQDGGDGHGDFARTTYRLQRTAGGARLEAQREGAFVPRPELQVRLWRADSTPLSVTLDGVPIPFTHDPMERTVTASFSAPPAFTLDLAYDPTITEPRPPIEVFFEVDVPADTPPGDTIHVASSAHGWQHLPLHLTGSTATGSISVPRGEWFFYKFTRGTWDTVEKWPDCEEADNRYAFGARQTYRDQVFNWRDSCE